MAQGVITQTMAARPGDEEQAVVPHSDSKLTSHPSHRRTQFSESQFKGPFGYVEIEVIFVIFDFQLEIIRSRLYSKYESIFTK